MNYQKLKQAEQRFLEEYPGGFKHPEMQKISLKHKPEKMTALAQESFQKAKFKAPQSIVDNMVKIISRSSMVSLFEKPKFRDFAYALNEPEKAYLAQGLYEFLYTNEEHGFNKMIDILNIGKLAKWSLITACPLYFRPQTEVFIKPTTAKNIIAYFEIQELHYQPTPTYQFYRDFRALIKRMQQEVDPRLAPGNAEFCGFLMMAMHNL